MPLIRYFNLPSSSTLGSIINDDTILTATHCAYAWRGQIMDKSDLSIYVGHVDRTTINEEYVFPAKSIEVNKEFASTIQHLDPTDPSKVTFAFNKGHDIAIIKLGRKVITYIISKLVCK